jgi:hypothetical protein
MPDFPTDPLGPLPLPDELPPGISIQALGTFGLQRTNLRQIRAKRRDPIVRELGIPLNARYYRAILDPPTGWPGLRLEVIGPEAVGPVPPDAFEWTDMFDTNHPLTIITWLRRVSCTAIPPMYLEMRWHPDTGTMNHEAWPSTIPDKDRKAFMAKARQLLRVIDGRGRRPGPDGFKDDQEFLDVVVGLIRTVHAQGRGTKQGTIATFLKPELDRRRGGNMSAASVTVDEQSTVRWLQKHLRPLSYTWAALVKEALSS